MMQNLFLAALAIAPALAIPSDIFARQACNRDNCLRAITSVRTADCSSFMRTTVTPCASTVTNTATVTVTATVTNYPLKREIAAGVEARAELEQRATTCAPSSEAPTGLPAFASTACTAQPTAGMAARFSSACACIGITAQATTVPAATSTVIETSTVTETVEARPTAFILQSTGDESLYVSLDNVGALRLTRDTSVAEPFYVDNSGQLRRLRDPSKLVVDVYEPEPGTADNKVYVAEPSASNYRITCTYAGRNDGDFWGQCQASGPPNGNPVVHGFGTCPNQGAYVYMIQNNSNVRCWDGGYAFLGFFLKTYTGN